MNADRCGYGDSPEDRNACRGADDYGSPRRFEYYEIEDSLFHGAKSVR